MSTDRELLELAAKAIGCLVTGWNTAQSEVVAVLDDGSFWQPLHKNRITDCDGDALRLAVKLRINLEHMVTMGGADFGINTWPRGRGDCGVSEDGDLSDYEAATRRAIVRAAAEIGRQLP